MIYFMILLIQIYSCFFCFVLVFLYLFLLPSLLLVLSVILGLTIVFFDCILEISPFDHYGVVDLTIVDELDMLGLYLLCV